MAATLAYYFLTLEVIETSTHTGLRDRALLATLVYTFARIGSVVNLKVEDYYPSGKRFLLRFKEKGGKEKELPVHHKLEEILDQYLKATGLEKEPESPLFPTSIGKTGKLSRRPLVRTDAADMLKRRLKQAGLPAHYSPHSFRATGITNFLENDGTLEAAQRIAGHADSRTTKLYDRRGPWQARAKTFESKDGNVSLVISTHWTNGITLQQRFSDEIDSRIKEGATINYSVIKDNWFVVSGSNSLGFEFYAKFIVFGDLNRGEARYITFTFAYPTSQRAIYDAAVTKMAREFVPDMPGDYDRE
jgi:hypothetical protein